MVKLYLSSKLSYQEVSLQTGIINPNLISHWVCQYRSGGPDALRPKKKGRQKALDTNTPNGKILSERYIKYYNEQRIKEKLGWMSPVEYRLTHLAA